MVTIMTKCSNLRQNIMDDVQRRYGEYLDKDKVSCITSKIAAAENKYPAKTILASAIFYIKVDTQSPVKVENIFREMQEDYHLQVVVCCLVTYIQMI